MGFFSTSLYFYNYIGYQRELNYKHDNGGFSAFGKDDKSFSSW